MKKQKHENKRRVDRDSQAEAVRIARIVDLAADNLAVCVNRMAERLYVLHPSAKEAICGVAGVEGLAETVLQRFNARRFDETDAPSLEAITRAAVIKHPVYR